VRHEPPIHAQNHPSAQVQLDPKFLITGEGAKIDFFGGGETFSQLAIRWLIILYKYGVLQEKTIFHLPLQQSLFMVLTLLRFKQVNGYD
jgi:hypothetical protein